MALPWVAPKHASAGTRHAWPAGAGGHGAAHAGHGVVAMRPGRRVRFGAGVASAVVLLNIAAWCMLRLVALGQPALGGLISTGRAWALRSRACRPAPWWPGIGPLRRAGRCLACCAWAVRWLAWWCGVCRRRAAAASSCLYNPRPGARSARSHARLWFGAGLGYIVTATRFAGDYARCLACWLGAARLVLASVPAWCGHGAACSPARASGVGPTLAAAGGLSAAGGCHWSEPGVARRAGLRWAAGCWACLTAITFLACKGARQVWPSAGTASPGCSPPLTVWADHRPPMVAWTLHRAATPSQALPRAGGGCGGLLLECRVVRGDGLALAFAAPLRVSWAGFVSSAPAAGAASSSAAPGVVFASARCRLCRPAMDRTSASPQAHAAERSLAPGRR